LWYNRADTLVTGVLVLIAPLLLVRYIGEDGAPRG
jgi:hypothetical protein